MTEYTGCLSECEPRFPCTELACHACPSADPSHAYRKCSFSQPAATRGSPQPPASGAQVSRDVTPSLGPQTSIAGHSSWLEAFVRRAGEGLHPVSNSQPSVPWHYHDSGCGTHPEESFRKVLHTVINNYLPANREYSHNFSHCCVMVFSKLAGNIVTITLMECFIF